MAVELIGAAPGTRLGELRRAPSRALRATFVYVAWSPDSLVLNSFQQTYDRIARTGWCFPLSEFEGIPGKRALVVDVGLLARSDGATVAQLAEILDPSQFEVPLVDLRTLEAIPIALVTNAGTRRDIQDLADSDERASDLVNRLGRFAGELRWIVVLALVAAIAVAGWKISATWRR